MRGIKPYALERLVKTLDLRRTQVTAEAVIRLAQRMPACKIGVDDEVLAKIKRLQKAAK